MTVRCASPKDGGCRFSAWNDGPLCVGCAAAAGDEAARAELSRRGSEGQAKTKANRAAARASEAIKHSVRTTEGQLQTLDTLLRNLMRSKLDAAKVAAAGGQLVKIAREVIAADELQAENRELRALIAERMPELKKHLKALP